MSTFEEHRRSFFAVADDMGMMMLALLSGIFLATKTVLPISRQLEQGIVALDVLIASIFLVEFVIRFLLSRSRIRFFKNYWWELLGAVPLSGEVFQGLRLLRLLRLPRLLRHVRLLAQDQKGLAEYRIIE